MRILQFTCLIVAFTIIAAYQIITGKTLSAPEAAPEVQASVALSSSSATSVMPMAREPADSDTLEKEQARLEAAFNILSEKTPSVPEAAEMEESPTLSSSFAAFAMPIAPGPSLLRKEETDSGSMEKEQARLEATFDALEKQQAGTEDSVQDHAPAPTPSKQNVSYLAYYVFSEILPDKKPADTVLETLKNIPIGTPIEEIKRASDAFGVNFNFMKAVAKIESDFNPKQRTGSYIGLFQLSKYEFKEYCS